ncbi:MAG TPA: hypothetical protein VD828_00075 [Candidatus Nitrosotenuis sp.]|nr:hypothetical protein [Candidatus Nitrosotenuis sp.]
MVFGWGKKKDSAPEQISKQDQMITLSEIESILQQKKHEKQNLAIRRTKPLFEQIQKEIELIGKIISQLKSDDLKVDDIDKTLKVLVVRSKSEVIEIISKESQKTLPQVLSYDDLVKASDVSSYILKKIGDVLGKHSRVIHVFAKKYAQDLKTHLELITTNQSAISKHIHDISSFDASSLTIRNTAEKILQLGNEIAEKTQHIDKLKEFQKECVDTINLTEQKVASMHSSSQFAKFLECQKQIKQVMAKQDDLNKEINDEFSKISRPLGKYVYVTSLEKPFKVILERLIVNHADTISSENKDAIVTVLESCMKGIMSGTVSVKETEKSVAQITHLISLLDDFIARKANLQSQHDDLQEKLGVFDSKQLEDLEKQLERAKLDSSDTESKVKTLEEDLDNDYKQRQKLIEDLQSSLEGASGIKYTIQF